MTFLIILYSLSLFICFECCVCNWYTSLKFLQFLKSFMENDIFTTSIHIQTKYGLSDSLFLFTSQRLVSMPSYYKINENKYKWYVYSILTKISKKKSIQNLFIFQILKMCILIPPCTFVNHCEKLFTVECKTN